MACHRNWGVGGHALTFVGVKVERLGLLRGVRVLGAGVHPELAAHHLLGQRGLGQHAVHGLLDHPLGMLGEHVAHGVNLSWPM